jgi:hypothetical protein
VTVVAVEYASSPFCPMYVMIIDNRRNRVVDVLHDGVSAYPWCLCVPFSEKLDSLLDRLKNRCTMHGSRNGALE